VPEPIPHRESHRAASTTSVGDLGTSRATSTATSSPGKRTLVDGLAPSAVAGSPSPRGQALQYYRRHQPAFLAAVHTQLIAANLGTGSPRLRWSDGAARFVEQFRFALTGPEPKELPELLYPQDPWAIIDAHRQMSPDATTGTGEMDWAPAAGVALASAVERSVRASLPRVAARYVAEQGGRSASILVAAHPMDRVVAEALVSDGVATLLPGTASAPRPSADGLDVQIDGIRVVTSYRWLGDRDPSLWNWIVVEEPADATVEEIAFTLWSRTDYAYGLTRIGGYVSIPKAWARQVPGVQVRGDAGIATIDSFAQSPAEQLARSKLAGGVALAQGARVTAGPTGEPATPSEDAPAPAPALPDRTLLIDTLDSTAVVLAELATKLAPWRLDTVLEGGRAFVARQRATLPSVTPAALAMWAPVLVGQRAIVGEAATGTLQALPSSSRPRARRWVRPEPRTPCFPSS
jgi:hypothetical protein